MNLDRNGKPSSKVSLFLLETNGKDPGNAPSGLNGMEIQRLKEKLGTRQLPTAEMLLDGAIAYQVSLMHPLRRWYKI